MFNLQRDLQSGINSNRSQNQRFGQNRSSSHTFSQEGNIGSRLMSMQDVHLHFGNIKALNGVDFKLHQKEIVFLTGVSGAGKTTFLKTLAGIYRPHRGKIERPDPRQTFISPIFQDLKLFDNKSCESNLFTSYDSSVYRNKKEFESDLVELCKMLGIYDRLHLKIKDANGGLKQKVAFVRTMLTRPDIVLADEPTAALDYENAKRIFDILNLYNVKQGLSVIWATHSKDLAKKFTGRMVHMDKGRIIYSGHACFI
jgi:ABC-type multidrug transport system ATPase subunit